ncbi:MAG: Asp-tRNA(Asn)/Glu-tRNA(Gln) amidotransferase subunit GatA [Phycisphaerae bacterium]|nr:Asp-tRNA(Asn)/Glu-tRNA(Gln) amidotransferase subunit GatA [Phycisphaerae bacterium]
MRSARDIARGVAAREFSAESVTREALGVIVRENSRVNAFTQVFHDFAIEQARRVDEDVAAGKPAGPLAGVPIALKDNICLSHGRTTCASRMLENYHSPFDATAARKLINAGAVVVGKTNLDEFAMGSSTEHSIFGPTRNPRDVTRVPGGSSGGSAAAVAAGMVPVAIGSDTGGSIRQPAAFCGLVGVKPTYGRVSRFGLVAYASSLDQIGPLARDCADAALVLDVLCGKDDHDATSADLPPPASLANVDEVLPGLVLGVPTQAWSPANHAGVTTALESSIAAYKKLGAKVIDIDLPLSDYAVAAYYIVAPAEASSNLARFDGVRYGRRAEGAKDLTDMLCKSRREGFGPEVRKRIMLGTHVLSSGYYDAYYTTALKVRRRVKDDFDAAFRAGCHAVLMPTTPGPAFAIGEKIGDALAMYMEDVYTVGVNLAGLPALSIPAGSMGASAAGGACVNLPIGVQLVGRAFDEARLMRIARMLERATDFAPAHAGGA